MLKVDRILPRQALDQTFPLYGRHPPKEKSYYYNVINAIK